MGKRQFAALVLCVATGCVGSEGSAPEKLARTQQAFAPPAGSATEFQLLTVRSSRNTVRGDFNGDGLQDYAYGDWGYRDGVLGLAGRVLTYHSSSCGEVPDRIPDQLIAPGLGGLSGAPAAFARFGYSMATGDFNNDGFDDLLIGAPGHGYTSTLAGEAFVVYGSPAGLQGAGSLRFDHDSPGMLGVSQVGDSFGYAVTAGDFDCDGIDDIAVAAPAKTVGGHNDAGAVSTLYGSLAGINTLNNQFISRDSGDVAMATSDFDRFGHSLVAADFGRPSGDHCADLAIGVPYADEAGNNAGAAHVLYGHPAGLQLTGTQHFHEGTPGVLSVPAANEGFGTRLDSWDDDHDGQPDLLVYNARDLGCRQRGATHLLLGSPTGVTSAGDKYACGDRNGPRFDISVAAPTKPRAYIPPAGISVSDSATLVNLLTNGVPDVIILEDDVYTHTSEVRPNAADQVWARNVGEAVLTFGVYYQFQPTPVTERAELHGITFDMTDVDPNLVIGGGGATSSAIVLAGPAGASMSLLVEDCFFYGHDWVDNALMVRRPEDVEIRRVVVRDVHEFGVRVDNPGGVHPNPTVVLEDIDVAGVAKPDGEDGLDGAGNAHPSYYCIGEAGVFVGFGLDTAEVNRVRVRDTRCAGIVTAVNRNEVVTDAGDFLNLDVDCAGHWPSVEIATGAFVPVTNAGLYLQESSHAHYGNIHIGPNTFDGVRSEWTGDNEGNEIHNALIESHRLGISLDANTIDSDVDNVVIENAYCAGVLDNYCGAPWAGTCDALMTPNTITAASYHLPPGALDVGFFNANQCPAPPP